MGAPKEFKLRSGNAVLRVNNVPFDEAEALFNALMAESKGLKFIKGEMAEVFKDLFAIGFSSPAVKKELWNVFRRCQYCDKRGELKIDKDTFEPTEARADYVEVCMLVVQETCGPFLNGLYVEFKTLFEVLAPFLA
jgi:hypothetical protein